jgi:iron(III) transport system ATP-binding protein
VPALAITGLRRRLGQAEVLSGVDLEVPAGALTCLLGPSGSGKTTLLKVLAGQLEAQGGRILYDGRDVAFFTAAERGVAFVHQNYALFPHLSVLENAAFALEGAGLSEAESRRRALEALQLVRAESWAARRPQELSGGQQQRVALARALALRPKLLLLDEPLSNLDAASRVEVRDEIRRLVRTTGLTVLCVLHDQKDALAMADRLAVMRAGRIVQAGAPIDVYRRPADSWTATFLGSANLIPGKVLRTGAGEFIAATALGEVRGALARPDTPPADGAPITVCIRPECLRLDFMAPDENAFAGTITDSLFQGDLSVHEFLTPAGVKLRISEANPRQRLGSKAAVFAWAEPEDVVGLDA